MKFISIFSLLICTAIISCNKVKIDTDTYTSSINVINAISSNQAAININFTGKDIIFSEARNLTNDYFDGRYASGMMPFAVPSGQPVDLALFVQNDTVKPFFTDQRMFNVSDIYSLYVSGVIGDLKVLLTQDTIPKHTDSTTGIRFVNLVPNATTLSVNIAGNVIGSEVTSLPYQGISAFKNYPAKSENQFYFFEITDDVTGNVISSFFYDNIARFRNVTLIVKGQVDGDPSVQVARIDNY
ncbi:MAG: hypothetical protein J7497_14150 [Chitinophagaceae bacterium]|nr:hypothetical protein [Chitinophagaceae bacterium]